MSIHSSRSAQPIGEGRGGAAMGTWGVWLTIIVLATFVAGLAAAALYLETGQPAWPPTDIEVPGRGLAAVAGALLLLAGGLSTAALRRLRAGGGRDAALLVAGALGGHLVTILVLVADLRGVTFRWDEHAYTSIYWVFTGMTMTFAGIGVLSFAAVLVQLLVGLVDAERHLELVNATITGWFFALSGVLLLVLVHVHPLVGGGT